MAMSLSLYQWIVKNKPWHFVGYREIDLDQPKPDVLPPKRVHSCGRYIYASIAEDMKLKSHFWQRQHKTYRKKDGSLHYEEEKVGWRSGGWNALQCPVVAKKPIPNLAPQDIYPREAIYGNDEIQYSQGRRIIEWTMYTIPRRLLVKGWYTKGGIVHDNNGCPRCSYPLKQSEKRYRPYGLPCTLKPINAGRCRMHGGSAPKGMASMPHIKRLRREYEKLIAEGKLPSVQS